MKNKNGLTIKEQRFADMYLETGNATQAALDVYDIGSKGGNDNYSTAASIANVTLKKAEVMHYLEKEVKSVKKNMLKLALSAENENVQVAAGKDILDRALGKAVSRIDHTSGGKRINTMSSLSDADLILLVEDETDSN